MLHGGIDNEGNLNGRFNKQWAGGQISKAQMQVRCLYLLCAIRVE